MQSLAATVERERAKMSAKHAVFDLGRIFSPTSPSRYALLLLNQSVLSESRFALLWKGARVRSCVDGGANRHGTIDIIWMRVRVGEYLRYRRYSLLIS